MTDLFESWLVDFSGTTYEDEVEDLLAGVLGGLLNDGCEVLAGHRALPVLYGDQGQAAGEAEWETGVDEATRHHGDTIVVLATGWARERYQDAARVSVMVRTHSSRAEALEMHRERCALVRGFFAEEQLSGVLDDRTTSRELLDAACEASGRLTVDSVERASESVREFDGERMAWMFTEFVTVRGVVTGAVGEE